MTKSVNTSNEPFVWEQPLPRIVQYQGRRFALRLEAVFWQQLESLAERRALRLGQMVAGLAENCQGPNLSSYVRGFCMVEAQRDVARQRLNAGTFDLLSILRGCPAPALLLDDQRMIVDTNQALQDWVGQPLPVLRQEKFDKLFVPRVMRPLDETMLLMRKRQLQRAQIQIAYMPPGATNGRQVMATLTGLPIGGFFYCLVWLHTGGRMLNM